MTKKTASITLFAGILALWLWLVVPTAYGVTVTPLKRVLESEQTALWDAAGGLGEDGTGGSAAIFQQQTDSEGSSGALQTQDFAVLDAFGDVVLYGETWAVFDLLWPVGVWATARTYAIENWSWYSMDSEGTSHCYGEFQITSDTPWQLSVEFSGEKYAGSILSMNACIYDSA